MNAMKRLSSRMKDAVDKLARHQLAYAGKTRGSRWWLPGGINDWIEDRTMQALIRRNAAEVFDSTKYTLFARLTKETKAG